MFVIMNSETEELWRKKNHYFPQKYPTEKGACIAAGRIESSDRDWWVVMTEEEFEKNHNPLVTVKSLMSGTEVQIRRSEVGGCCDPSTERYWSM